jgi:hypothetical protein
MSLHNLMRIGESASNNHAAGTKYQEHFKIIVRKGYIPQQICNPYGAVMNFKHVTAPNKEANMDMQKKTKKISPPPSESLHPPICNCQALSFVMCSM